MAGGPSTPSSRSRSLRRAGSASLPVATSPRLSSPARSPTCGTRRRAPWASTSSSQRAPTRSPVRMPLGRRRSEVTSVPKPFRSIANACSATRNGSGWSCPSQSPATPMAGTASSTWCCARAGRVLHLRPAPSPAVFADLRRAGTETLVTVSDVEEAEAAIEAGADALVVQGRTEGPPGHPRPDEGAVCRGPRRPRRGRARRDVDPRHRGRWHLHAGAGPAAPRRRRDRRPGRHGPAPHPEAGTALAYRAPSRIRPTPEQP